jgi:hypothetical protein
MKTNIAMKRIGVIKSQEENRKIIRVYHRITYTQTHNKDN